MRHAVLLVMAAGCGVDVETSTTALTCGQNICQTLTVPTDIPTIQGALDQIGDGGTIVVRPGNYTETLLVSGKHVHLVGANGVTLRSANPQRPLVTFTPGSGGSVEHMRLRPSGDGITGIAASPNDTVPSPDVALRSLTIMGGGTGIAGAYAALSASKVDIHGALAGVTLDMVGPGGAAFSFLDVFDAGGAAVVIDNRGGLLTCEGTLAFADSTFIGRKPGGISRVTATAGGLAITGDYCPIQIDHCAFERNFGFGLALVDTGAFDVDSFSSATMTHLDDAGQWGAGVVVYQSDPSRACIGDQSIIDFQAHDNEGPGLVVRGTQCPITVTRGDYQRNTSFGILAADASSAQIVAANIGDTRVRASDGLFGDGLTVVDTGLSPTSVTTTLAVIAGSARAGISNFGGDLHIGDAKLECNAIHLDGETYAGNTPAFDDLGGNACGCAGASVTCQVLSTGLAPPEPIPTGP